MAEKKTEKRAGSGLPVNTEDLTPSANITYNNEVVAIIAGLAANEVEGIAGMCNVSGSLMGKNRNITKGVKVEVGTEEVAVYCNGCERGILLGGGKPVHMIELLASGLQ